MNLRAVHPHSRTLEAPRCQRMVRVISPTGERAGGLEIGVGAPVVDDSTWGAAGS